MISDFGSHLIETIPGLSTTEAEKISEASTFRVIQRKFLLLEIGEICRAKFFVLSGLISTYACSADGNKHILKFSDEGSWLTEPESYYTGKPSKYAIEAIEQTEIVSISHDDFERLRLTITPLREFSESVVNERMADVQKRILTNISSSAEEKYADFVEQYPNVYHRVPLHMVASYLGVTRETLTRIRHAQLLS